LLATFVRRDLKVRYQSSVLGFLWSLLNPLVYLIVYYLVFEVFLKNGIPSFPIFLLAGLLPWLMFSGALLTATASITANGSLVKKVWFPRALLPLSSVGTTVVNFLFQLVILALALVIFRWSPDLPYLPAAVVGLLSLVVVAAAISLLVSVSNVRARDTMHLVEVATIVWFWLTPIVYPFERPYQALQAHGLGWVYLLNPATITTISMQRLFYGQATAKTGGPGTPLVPDRSAMTYLTVNIVVLLAACAFFLWALRLFGRHEGDLAEDI
jgi:ABC-2 type transport system permease protein